MHKNLKLAREEYIKGHLSEAIKVNPKRFWSYVKRLKQENPGIADFEVDGKVISDGLLKSEILNSQFSSVFTEEDLENIPEMRSDPTPGLGSLIISEQGVLKQLSSLNPNKASGPNQTRPWFLKTFATDIAPILTDVFQDSIDSGTVPCRWKEANILEHIVHSFIMKHLNHHNILADCQQGFRAKTSTEMQLILTLHDIAKTIQSSSIHAAVLDFAKAFDKVPHRRLLRKLQYDGIQGSLLNCDADCDLLQSDLRRLESWQYHWQIEFNPSKCKIVTISHNNNPPQRKYVFCGVELEQVDTFPYLGVTISNKLKWSAHVSITAAKASKSLGTIQGNLWNCPKKVKEIAYTSLVRRKLDYASAAWDPFLKKDISALEMVQRKAARFCSQNYDRYASVTDMIKDLGWATLETRRRQARLTLMYKLTHGLIDINTRKYLIQHPESHTRGTRQFKFRVPYANKDVFKFSFFSKTITD
ncbi:uncharacterized protein [Montipora capricornis]|uniref:uncharacterized protein n=1 Tax=Montipora capricornis TaxID=246305 RepID=UPI0035F1CD58